MSISQGLICLCQPSCSNQYLLADEPRQTVQYGLFHQLQNGHISPQPNTLLKSSSWGLFTESLVNLYLTSLTLRSWSSNIWCILSIDNLRQSANSVELELFKVKVALRVSDGVTNALSRYVKILVIKLWMFVSSPLSLLWKMTVFFCALTTASLILVMMMFKCFISNLRKASSFEKCSSLKSTQLQISHNFAHTHKYCWSHHSEAAVLKANTGKMSVC